MSGPRSFNFNVVKFVLLFAQLRFRTLKILELSSIPSHFSNWRKRKRLPEGFKLRTFEPKSNVLPIEPPQLSQFNEK